MRGKDSMKKVVEDDKIKQGYTMRYDCPNCGNTYLEHFEYGQRAVQGVCPHCGVDSNRKEAPHGLD